MKTSVHSFTINLSWNLIKRISEIDRFDASWSSIEKREGQTLKQLKSIATVRSIGASTRIEGSQLSDDQIEALLLDVDISKLADRDTQEAVGYFNALDFISESWKEIDITENNLKYLHQTLLRYSPKDDWHRGEYKQQSNAVEARMPDGSVQTIFQTMPPGFPTQDAMNALIDWYANDKQTHPLVKCAICCYEFVTIHPFQDGNGRLSRLLATLLLLKHNYAWIEYVSFEHEIESRKAEYYRVLRSCQAGRPDEDVTGWVAFFLDALASIQQALTEKLNITGVIATLSPRDKAIITFVENHPGSRSGVIGGQLNIPGPTVKKALADLVAKNLLKKHGAGPGTNYSVA